MRSIINYPLMDDSGGVSFSSELDDIIILSKSYVNAGAGWQYQKYAGVFESTPSLFAQVINTDNHLIFVKDISTSGFYYKIKTLAGEETADPVEFHIQAIDYGGE